MLPIANGALTVLSRRRMSAIYRLHAEGIVHGQLRDAGHFLYSQDGRVRIVDFSTAQLHHCPNHWDGSAFERGPSPEPLQSHVPLLKNEPTAF